VRQVSKLGYPARGSIIAAAPCSQEMMLADITIETETSRGRKPVTREVLHSIPV
jgi:hypothetical protein